MKQSQRFEGINGYSISFENESNATAPAQNVYVTDVLDPYKVNINLGCRSHDRRQPDLMRGKNSEDFLLLALNSPTRQARHLGVQFDVGEL